MKTRKSGKLYTFQNIQANHLLGMRLIDRLWYSTRENYYFSPGKVNKTTSEIQHNRIQISINYVNFLLFMNQAVITPRQDSERRWEGDVSMWDS